MQVNWEKEQKQYSPLQSPGDEKSSKLCLNLIESLVFAGGMNTSKQKQGKARSPNDNKAR
jgi:hypothetical protein